MIIENTLDLTLERAIHDFLAYDFWLHIWNWFTGQI